jgi:Uma2 family endonuclease
MSTVLEPEVALPKVHLVETDGIPLESPWHRTAINLLIEVLTWLFRQRTDYYVGGNMFIYFDEQQARTRKYRGPDFFYVDGVNRWPERPYWAVWQEGGRYPDVIIDAFSNDGGRRSNHEESSLRTHVSHGGILLL